MGDRKERIKTRSIRKPVNVSDKSSVLQDLLSGGKGNVKDDTERKGK